MKVGNAYELITEHCKGYETFAENYNARLFHVIISGVDIQLNGSVVINGASTIATEIDDLLVEKLVHIASHANTGDKIIEIEKDPGIGCIIQEFTFRDGLSVVLNPNISNIIKNGILVREIETDGLVKCWME